MVDVAPSDSGKANRLPWSAADILFGFLWLRQCGFVEIAQRLGRSLAKLGI